MTERVNDIVRGLSERRADSDFTPVFNEIRRAQNEDPNFWRRHGAEINQRVDFQSMGFATDFEIVGLSSRNQLITTEGGAQAQLRGSDRLRQQGNVVNRTEGELWGNQNRRFRLDEQGNAVYTLRQGDNLSHIARDILSHNNGRVPTNQEIARTAAELARVNNLGPRTVFHPGQEVRVPLSMRGQTPEGSRPGQQQRPEQTQLARPGQPAQPAPAPEAGALIRPLAPVVRPPESEMTRPENLATPAEARRPSATASQFAALSPRGDIFNPLAPPGQVLEIHRGASPLVERPATPQVVTTEGGRNHVVETQRMVVETVPRNTPGENRHPITVETTSTRDAVADRVRGRTAVYSEPMNIRFDDGRGGSVNVPGVTQIHTRYVDGRNGEPGTYQSVVRTRDDIFMRFTLNDRGQVIDAPRLR